MKTPRELFLPGLPAEKLLRIYSGAPGSEISSGKFASPESSAALAANAFGMFLETPQTLPPLAGTGAAGWPALTLTPEQVLRFPWRGGRHPCLDVVIHTSRALIGIESKRYEPYRSKSAKTFSKAFWRPVWGDNMRGYQAVRDDVRDGVLSYERLDACQLVKHALGLRAQADHQAADIRLKPILVYLYAEPTAWPDGKQVSHSAIQQHRTELADFRARVSNDEVLFRDLTYRELLDQWKASQHPAIARHAALVQSHFRV